MPSGIVLELQQDCLDTSVKVGAILRKAKAIAAKLDLDELSEWIDQELDGYRCAMTDLPDHRKVGGSPRFWNPYHGWCPIISQNEKFSEILNIGYLPSPIAQLEEWASEGDTLIYRYPHVIQEALRKSSPGPFEAVMHISVSQITSALDFVRNKILAWTLELEKNGVVGEGFSFNPGQKKEAQSVTNHIYGGNIGVVGNVGGDANNSHFVNSSGVDAVSLKAFLDQAIPASAGLDDETREKVQPLLEDLREEVDGNPEPGRVSKLVGSLRTVLEGASGNLVATAILGAITGGMTG